MRFVDGWLIETTRGETFRLLTPSGHYPSLEKAMEIYQGPFYLIMTTGVMGSEIDILNMVTEKNKVDLHFENGILIAEGAEVDHHLDIRATKSI